MFSGCSSLLSLNLNNFSIGSGGGYMKGMFQGCNPYIIFCFNDSSLIKQIQNDLNYSVNNCYDLCFTPNHKIIKENNRCIDDCANDIEYKYEYNNICYKTIQEICDDSIDSSIIII